MAGEPLPHIARRAANVPYPAPHIEETRTTAF